MLSSASDRRSRLREKVIRAIKREEAFYEANKAHLSAAAKDFLKVLVKQRYDAIRAYRELMKDIPLPTSYQKDADDTWYKQKSDRPDSNPKILANRILRWSFTAQDYVPIYEQVKPVWPEARVNTGQYGPQASTVVPSGFFGAARR